VEPAADSAAMVQEAGQALVDPAWVVMVGLALVRFRVVWSEIEASLAAIYNIFQRADIILRNSSASLGMTNYCNHLL
jgi:hypothetical protein